MASPSLFFFGMPMIKFTSSYLIKNLSFQISYSFIPTRLDHTAWLGIKQFLNWTEIFYPLLQTTYRYILKKVLAFFLKKKFSHILLQWVKISNKWPLIYLMNIYHNWIWSIWLILIMYNSSDIIIKGNLQRKTKFSFLLRISIQVCVVHGRYPSDTTPRWVW